MCFFYRFWSEVWNLIVQMRNRLQFTLHQHMICTFMTGSTQRPHQHLHQGKQVLLTCLTISWEGTASMNQFCQIEHVTHVTDKPGQCLLIWKYNCKSLKTFLLSHAQLRPLVFFVSCLSKFFSLLAATNLFISTMWDAA